MPLPRPTLLIVLAVAAGHAAAQKYPVPGDSKRLVQVFDVRDLVARDDDKDEAVQADTEVGLPMLKEIPILGFLFGRKGQGAAPAGAPPKLDLKARRMRLAQLVDAVRSFITPPLGEGEEVKSIGDGMVTALATPDKLAWIERFLRANRERRGARLEIEWNILTLDETGFAAVIQPLIDASERVVREPVKKDRPDDLAGRASPPNEAAPPAALDTKYALLETEAAFAELQRKLKATAGAEIITAPKLLTTPLTGATLHLGNKISYVRDFDIQVKTASIIADPVIDVVWDGIVMGCTAALLQGDRVGIAFDCGMSEVVKPIPTFTTTIGVGSKVTIQLPEIKMTKIDSRVELAAGHTALFTTRTSEGKRAVLLIRARSVQPGAKKK